MSRVSSKQPDTVRTVHLKYGYFTALM